MIPHDCHGDNEMAKDTATIALLGDVSIADFSKAVAHFKTMIESLSSEVANAAKIQWELESLEVSSAIVTVRGIPSVDDDIAVAEVLDAYERVGYAAQRGVESTYSLRVNNAARGLCGLINGHVSSIRFETEDADIEVISPIGSANGHGVVGVPREAIGTIRGRAQSMSNRGTLRFTVYDENDDHAIACYLREGLEEKMRLAWGQMCVISGTVRRSASGKVSTVRDVVDVVILDEHHNDSWRDAIGCAPALAGSISVEEAIRRGRDG